MRKKHIAANPCATCGGVITDTNDAVRRRIYCSELCRTLRGAKNERTCLKCKKTLTWEDFPVSHGRRQHSCKVCFTPYKRPLRPLVTAPAPCATCNKVIRLRVPPSRMTKRKYCNIACATGAPKTRERKCLTCRRMLPTKSFAHRTEGEGGYVRTCNDCFERRMGTQRRGVGHMYPFGLAHRLARTYAKARNLPFTVTPEELDEAYGTPCRFCAAPGCVFRPLFADLGYITGGIDVVCWMCARLSDVRGGSMEADEIVAYARAIVKNNPPG